jgi:hypothetical protein
MRKFFAIATAVASVTALGLVTAVSASAAVKPVYSSVAKPAVPNLPSLGVEAYSFNQIGDQVNLAGRARHLSSVRVTLSDWACQTGGSAVTTTNPNSNCLTDAGSHFSTAVTLNIYAAGVAGSSPGETVPGELLKTVTRTFAIPFRPSASNRCSTPAFADAGGWYDSKTNACYHGLDNDIVFANMGEFTLPNRVVYGISYNSDTSGPNPIGGTNSPTDSLNVALSTKVTSGSQVTPGGIWWDTRYAGFSDGLPFVTSEFNLDGPTASGNWDGYIPAVQINAS